MRLHILLFGAKPVVDRIGYFHSLHPALPRLSAMISHDFIGRLPVSLPDEFPTQRNLSVPFPV